MAALEMATVKDTVSKVETTITRAVEGLDDCPHQQGKENAGGPGGSNRNPTSIRRQRTKYDIRQSWRRMKAALTEFLRILPMAMRIQPSAAWGDVWKSDLYIHEANPNISSTGDEILNEVRSKVSYWDEHRSLQDHKAKKPKSRDELHFSGRVLEPQKVCRWLSVVNSQRSQQMLSCSK